MRIRKGVFPSSASKPLRVIDAPYIFLSDTQQTVTTGAGAFIFPVLPVGSIEYSGELRNVSTGTQSIRVGSAPAFSTNGILLMPGDSHIFRDVSLRYKATASAAGALLDLLLFAR